MLRTFLRTTLTSPLLKLLHCDTATTFRDVDITHLRDPREINVKFINAPDMEAFESVQEAPDGEICVIVPGQFILEESFTVWNTSVGP